MATEVSLNNFVINNVESPEVWAYMLGNGLVNENEFYIVQNDIPVGFRQTTVSILAANWVGTASPYSQVVSVNTATGNTRVDLQPSAAQISDLQGNEISLMAENDGNGVITVYAIGNKPTVDYSMQALLSEVTVV